MTVGPLERQAVRLRPHVSMIALGGIALSIAALFLPQSIASVGVFVTGMVFLWCAVLLRIFAYRHARAQARLRRTVAGFVASDETPAFTTDLDGIVGYENDAAVSRFGGRGGKPLLRGLEEIMAAPSVTLAQMQSRAQARGFAREDITMNRGHARVSVHRLGEAAFLWRIDEISDSAIVGQAGEIALPMLVLGPSGSVVSTNDALRKLIGRRETSLDRIVRDLPLRNGEVHSLTGGDGPVLARVAVFDCQNGCKEVFFSSVAARYSGEWDAFDALPVALLRVSSSGEIRQSNRPARDILGIDTHKGMTLGDLVEGLGRPVQDWVRDIALGRQRKPEFVRASLPKSDTFLQITLNRIEGEDLVAVLTDATELKSLEAQFVQSQKMQAIGQLAGGVAHDFNNLLTAISGHCDLLLLRHDKNDPEYSDLVQIHQNANRAASLVGQLLAFSRKQTLKPEVIDLRDTLSDLTHLLNRLVGEKVTLSLDHEAGLLPIRVDKRQLEQVIMNLVVNARDAMPAGGAIKVETRNEVLTSTLTRDRATVPEGEYVTVRVSDQGIGISSDKLQKVFEPFYTTKRTGEGTGLGLSTAYGIIKQTGGFIFVDSVVGAGTAFTIYLPAHTATAEAAVEAEVASVSAVVQSDAGTGVILLVEDEAPVRAFASRALKLRGYTVLEADCAEHALETLDDPNLHVDIIVSDVIMPGMDGPTWVSKARESRPDVKVVFVSGYAEDHFGEKQARIPNSVFLPKPFSLSELTATVQAQFG
ncbi:ATP-binding protein [Celeribacter arenosi]